jgi:hypothetical protein
MRYFSYGLTVSEAEMYQACPEAQLVGPATLHCHELRFSQVADVVLNLQTNVSGIVWEIPEEYIDMITAYERHDVKRQLMIKLNGDTMRAWVSHKKLESDPRQPSWDYWQDIESAYSDANIPLDLLFRASDLTDYYIDLNQNF